MCSRHRWSARRSGVQTIGPTVIGRIAAALRRYDSPMFALPARVGEAAAALRLSHPEASALAVLDVVMRGDTGARVDLSAAWLMPGSPFGQVLAAALDLKMTPEEWARWTRPPADPALQSATLVAWRGDVLAAFVARYRLTV